jgi:hypothetical protein
MSQSRPTFVHYELASRFGQMFCACSLGWKTYTRCPHTHCRTCRLYAWKEAS